MKQAINYKSATLILNQEYRIDPTKTLTLRNAFDKDMQARFKQLIRAISTIIVDLDVFGLKPPQKGFKLNTKKLKVNATPEKEAWKFLSSAEKQNQFMEWLKLKQETGILETIKVNGIGGVQNVPWTNTYIQDSYKRGVQRARYELNKAGYTVPSIAESGGISVVMNTPFHIDRVGLLYSRVFEGELKGVTAAMDSQISRVLAQGLADGDGARTLAAKLRATIDGTGMSKLAIKDSLGRFIPAARRASMIAQTEVIRAHHQAMVQEYKDYGLYGVKVKAEWKTGGFNVCPKCEALEGNIYTLKQIESMIPLHPRCKCIALPVVVDEDKKAQPKTVKKKPVKKKPVETKRLQKHEFEDILKEKGYTYTSHTAMSGSQYWTINGQPYRLADHFNPNKPSWLTSKVEVSNFEGLLKVVEEKAILDAKVNIVDEWIFDELNGGFVKNPNFKG